MFFSVENIFRKGKFWKTLFVQILYGKLVYVKIISQMKIVTYSRFFSCLKFEKLMKKLQFWFITFSPTMLDVWIEVCLLLLIEVEV